MVQWVQVPVVVTVFRRGFPIFLEPSIFLRLKSFLKLEDLGVGSDNRSLMSYAFNLVCHEVAVDLSFLVELGAETWFFQQRVGLVNVVISFVVDHVA